MPELPEVETTRRGLLPILDGRRIARVEARRPDLRFPLPVRFGERLVGRRVQRIDRRAKYILVGLDDGATWLVHLGMSGRLLVGHGAPAAAGTHDHVLVETEDGGHLVYNDVRRFGFMDLIAAEGLAGHPRLAGLGLEPLEPGFDGASLARLLAGRRTSIKAALLDQRLVVGIGNIYACEALNRARIDPFRLAGSLDTAACARLVDAIRSVLEEAIAAGGSSLRDYVQTSGELGYFQHRWAVYGREGETCRCGSNTVPIARTLQGGRSTFWCPSCQE